MKTPTRWDAEYDVVIGGYGFAGAMSAITAHDAGARVVVYEKMPHFGGNSILSGGSVSVAIEAEGAGKYLRHIFGKATDQGVVETFIEGMLELPSSLSQLCQEVGFELVFSPGAARGAYPLPGTEAIRRMYVTRNERYKGFPWVKGAKAGATLFWVLREHMNRRSIDVRYNTALRELVTHEDGAVIGVRVENGQRELAVKARRAVILCTGGFEHNARLLAHYSQIQEAISMSPLGNTGDGILMAQKAGAALWHMWHFHGGYGFKIPGLPIAVRHNWRGFRDDNRRMPWIGVDRFGKRFMNEYPPCPQDTPIRALEYYDADIQDYPRIPCHLIFDDEGRALGPIGQPIINDELLDLTWSANNLKEVELGIIIRRDTLEELASYLRMDCSQLRETVDRWNQLCREGYDRDFHRPGGTMIPIERPPFYTIAAWPIISNTQGGPVHNPDQQVTDPFNRPIPRLYAAGELGSVFGHLYELSGNLTECFVGGRTAGLKAAAEVPWD